MRGLTVRWSLSEAAPDVLEQLASYVEGTSHARFSGMDGLAYKTWRARPGEWFEGCYVFTSDQARLTFQETFEADLVGAAGSRIVGAAPVLVEPCAIVAIAEGWDGFAPAARTGEV